MIPRPRSRYVDLNGSPLHLADHGGDGPPLVLVHGLGGSHVNWAATAPMLARQARVVAPDLPGFGLSAPVERHDLEAHGEAVRGVIEWLEAGPVTLVGNSLGGLVAETVAAKHPEAVSSLVLIAPATPIPPGVSPSDRLVLGRLALQSLPGIGQAMTRLFQAGRSPEEIVDLTLGIVAADPGAVTPELRALGVEMAERRARQPWAVRAFTESAIAARQMLVPPKRFLDTVDAIEAPTRVLVGSADRIVTPEAVEALCQRREWELIHLEGVGHVPMLEAPATTAELVVEHLPVGRSATTGAE